MILTPAQADVVAALAAHVGDPVALEDTNIDRAVVVTPQPIATRFSDYVYQYMIAEDGSTIRIGGREGMVSVDNKDFHVKGVDHG